MSDVGLVNRLLGGAATEVTERSFPVPGDLRSEWRVALVLLLLGKCHGGSATLEQLHVVNSSALFEATSETLVNVLATPAVATGFDRPLVRYEPALSRAVDIAVGVGLVDWTDSQRLSLTLAGREAHGRLTAQPSLLSREKELLARIPGRVSQAAIDRVLSRRR